jgi:drug/metabolite transporter (DMT)-like permease
MEINKEKIKNADISKGIWLMIASAFFTANGQLFWKLAVNSDQLMMKIVMGFVLYGIGAVLMIIAFKFGELSVLYPMMCVAYIFAIINGWFFLNETLTLGKLGGILLIIMGVSLLGKGSK